MARSRGSSSALARMYRRSVAARKSGSDNHFRASSKSPGLENSASTFRRPLNQKLTAWSKKKVANRGMISRMDDTFQAVVRALRIENSFRKCRRLMRFHPFQSSEPSETKRRHSPDRSTRSTCRRIRSSKRVQRAEDWRLCGKIFYRAPKQWQKRPVRRDEAVLWLSSLAGQRMLSRRSSKNGKACVAIRGANSRSLWLAEQTTPRHRESARADGYRRRAADRSSSLNSFWVRL